MSKDIKILVAGENPPESERLKQLLKHLNYFAVFVGDDISLDYIRQNKPQIIIIAANLPKRANGENLCRAIKADKQLKEISVILLSSGSPEDKQCGEDYLLVKPFDENLLAARVENIALNFELQKMREQLRRNSKDSNEKVAAIAETTQHNTAVADEVLREQREFFRMIIDTSPSNIFVKDTEGRYVFVNHALAELFGTTVENLIGKTAEDVMPNKEDAQRVFDQDDEVIASQRKKFIREEPITDATTGDVHWFQTIKKPLLSATGTVSHVLGVATDITERKRSEKRLAMQNKIARILAESGTVDDTITKIIRTVCKNLNWSFGEFWRVDKEENKLRCEEIWRAEDIDMMQSNGGNIGETFEAGAGLPGRVWQNGRPFWIADILQDKSFERKEKFISSGLAAAFAFPVQLGGETLGVLTFFSRDFHMFDEEMFNVLTAVGRQLGQFLERKHAAEELRAQQQFLNNVIDANPNIIFVKDRDGRFVLANKALAEIYGTNVENLLGRTDADFNSNAEEVAAYVRADREVMDNLRERFVAQEPVTNATTGEMHWFQTIKKPLFSADGQSRQVLGVGTDITERKKAHELLEKKEAQLVEAQRIARVGSWTFDLRSRAVIWSDEMFRIMGYGLNEIVPTYEVYLNLIHPDDRKFVIAAHKRMMRERTGYRHEHRLLLPDGTIRFMEANATASTNQAGKVVSVTGTAQDITERKLTEEKLEASRAELVEAQKIAQIGSWAADLTTKTITWSDELYRILGYEHQEIEPSYEAYLNVVHPDDLDFVLKEHRKIESEKIALRHEHRLRLGNGIIRFVDMNAAPICDESGNIIKFTGTLQDVTRRKLAEEKLRENEEWLRAIFDASRDGVVVEDEGIIVYANNAEAALFGYDAPEELLGKHITELLQPEERERLTEYGSARLNGEARPTSYEFNGMRKDGSLIELEAAVSISEVAGKKYITIAIRDITERKKIEREIKASEQRYRALITASAQVVWVADAAGHSNFVTTAWEDLTGLSIEQSRGTGWLDALHPETAKKSARLWQQAVENRTIFEDEQMVRIRDGSYRIFHARGVPIFDEGEILEWVGTLTDITERRQAEQALAQSEQDYRTVFEQAHDAILIFAPEREIVLDVNRRACEIYGFDRSEFVGMSLEDISKDAVQGTQKVKETLEKGDFFNFETIQYRRDKSEMFLEVNASAINYQGQQAIISINRDVTARKQAEQALRDSEAKFRSITQTANDAIIVCDKSGNIISWNKGAQTVFGYTEEEALSIPMIQIMPEAYRQAHLAGIQRLKNGGEPHIMGTTMELYGLRKDGSQFPLELSISNYKTNGETFYSGIIRDTTDRKQAEDALRRSEASLAYAQRLTHLGNWELEILDLDDASKNTIHCSDEIYRIFDYEPGQIDLTGEKFYSFVDPDERTRISEAMFKAIRKRENLKIDFSINLPGGRKRALYMQAEVIYDDKSNKPVKLIGIIQDTTDRKRAQEKLARSENELRTLFSAMSDVIIELDDEGRYTKIAPTNPSLLYKPSEELLGKKLHEVFPAETADMFLGHIKEALDSKQPVNIEYSLPINEREVVFYATIKRITETSVLLVARDITDRKQAEENLKLSEERLQQAQKMEAIGTLTGGVAHDFNNLLTAILGNTQLALRTAKKDEILQRRLSEIEKAGNRAAGLTRQLLAFSRRQHLERRQINLNESIAEITKLLERIIGADVEVVVKYADDLEMVFADPAQIEQVVMNLAVNARDAMPSGGLLTIEVCNKELDKNYCRQYPYVIPGRYVQIMVSDTGTGMDEEIKTHIFEPFFTTKAVGKGTGLGLSMAYGIIKQHDGHIHVYSEPGHGTTFKIFLPVIAKSVEEEETIESAQPSLFGGTETILVAEDEEVLRSLAKDTLEELGYTVLLAKDGEEAVEIFQANSERIDLFLSDVIMPRMGGSEAYEQIRELGGNIPLIFMTGYSSETIQSHFLKPKTTAEKLGAMVIQKPYTLEELGRIVRDTLDSALKTR